MASEETSIAGFEVVNWTPNSSKVTKYFCDESIEVKALPSEFSGHVLGQIESF